MDLKSSCLIVSGKIKNSVVFSSSELIFSLYYSYKSSFDFDIASVGFHVIKGTYIGGKVVEILVDPHDIREPLVIGVQIDTSIVEECEKFIGYRLFRGNSYIQNILQSVKAIYETNKSFCWYIYPRDLLFVHINNYWYRYDVFYSNIVFHSSSSYGTEKVKIKNLLCPPRYRKAINKLGKIIAKRGSTVFVLFDEDVGGSTLDGKYRTGSVIAIDEKFLVKGGQDAIH